MRDAATASTFLAKVVMWIVWVALVNGCFFFAFFLTQSKKPAELTPTGSPGIAILSTLAVFGLAVALRFGFIPRIRNPWVQLLPYVVGAILSQQILLFGIFMLREYLVIFSALCAVAMLCYLPIGIKPKPIGAAPVA